MCWEGEGHCCRSIFSLERPEVVGIRSKELHPIYHLVKYSFSFNIVRAVYCALCLIAPSNRQPRFIASKNNE
ncbi:hypothetical protein K1719_008836 [Acacia pycnantha]|nr:hypothetical protein K1719_008836 [Acacia pycnantha]